MRWCRDGLMSEEEGAGRPTRVLPAYRNPASLPF